MPTVPAGKRGAHSDFALSEQEIKDLIAFCPERRTRAMITLASLGVPIRGIVAFQANHHLTPLGLDIMGVTPEVIPLSPKQHQLLSLFPLGFGVTNVTIWRRIKKVIIDAGHEGVISFDPDHIPFPAALAQTTVEYNPSTRQMIAWCLSRIHAVQARLPNAEFGTVAQCPHKDCEYLRQWLRKERP